MSNSQRIYLDHAATSWPKPESVYQAVDHFQRKIGAPHGRSGYREALESNRVVEQARGKVAALIGAAQAEQLVFTASGTDSLNLAILGLMGPGDHVVTTVCEHNSVLRPLSRLQESKQAEVTYVPCNGQGIVSAHDIIQALRPTTRLVILQHGSNVTGAIQPIEPIARSLTEHKALLLVDAAQTVGHVPLDVVDMGIDLLAAPGHKGLLGPLGTGILYLRPGLEQELRPLRMGGTGTQSSHEQQPEQLPHKYESGSPNLPGIAGLAAACDFLKERTISAIHAQLISQTDILIERLENIARQSNTELKVYGPKSCRGNTMNSKIEQTVRTSVVSLTLGEYDPQELAILLEASCGIQGRAGLHCAPRMHQALGTHSLGGTLRLSLGWSTTQSEIDQTVEAIAALAGSS